MSNTEGKALPLGSATSEKIHSRADEVHDLLDAVKDLIIPFIRAADDDAASKSTGHGLAIPGGGPRTSLVEYHPPEKLTKLLDLSLPNGEGDGRSGLLKLVEDVLRFSVNTWDQGFLDKLYASTNAVGVISDLLLSVLNTNLHVFAVSPALTIIEKTTTKALASHFRFTGPHSGGISTQGGSASNLTAISIARTILFPETKTSGNGNRKLVLFTSAHGHYSLSKAAIVLGLGSDAVISVSVDESGRMIPERLDEAMTKAKNEGQTPFFVNGTAGTTVLGSFDPLLTLSVVAKKHKAWFHVDGSWGGSVIFSATQKHKLDGIEAADSVAVNPHKMLGVPVTCSFLLGPDMRIWHNANTLRAGYLFHDANSNDEEVWDLADLTLQCGRRGDSLKFALSWVYYGASGYEEQVNHAFSVASHLANLVAENGDLVLVSSLPPPCLQVCFYYAPGGKLGSKQTTTEITRTIVRDLVSKGFMIDWAPGQDEAKGGMLRVVVNIQTRKETVDGLVKGILQIGKAL